MLQYIIGDFETIQLRPNNNFVLPLAKNNAVSIFALQIAKNIINGINKQLIFIDILMAHLSHH